MEQREIFFGQTVSDAAFFCHNFSPRRPLRRKTELMVSTRKLGTELEDVGGMTSV